MLHALHLVRTALVADVYTDLVSVMTRRSSTFLSENWRTYSCTALKLALLKSYTKIIMFCFENNDIPKIMFCHFFAIFFKMKQKRAYL